MGNVEFVYYDPIEQLLRLLVQDPQLLDLWVAKQQGKESASCSGWQDIMLSLQSELKLLFPKHCFYCHYLLLFN